MLHGGPQAKLVRIQELGGSLGLLPTGSAQAGVTIIADTTIPNQHYVMVWPDQRQRGVLGPTGAGGGDRQNTGPRGHPTGPTGGGPPLPPPSFRG